jgi:hypothetical protein
VAASLGCGNLTALAKLQPGEIVLDLGSGGGIDVCFRRGAWDPVCDSAAAEVCPVWLGQPVTAHWGVPDPATGRGSEEEITRAFRDAFVTLGRRIDLFPSLPLEKLGTLAVKNEVERIGRE